MSDLPEFYFRIRENGAVMFRVDTENRQRRIEMSEVAVINVRNGNIKPHGEHVLTEDEMEVITEWLEARRAVLAERDLDDIHRAIDHLNLTTQWVQSRASEEDLDNITDRLLLAMHDLRSVLVRKKADRVIKAQKAARPD